MRNQIEFGDPPQDLFLDPLRDPGVYLLSRPEFFWKHRPPAVIEGFAASAHDAVNDRLEALLRSTRRHRSFAQVVEFNTVPVLLHEARFRKSYAAVSGKCLLNGAAGTRLLNRHVFAKGADGEPAAEAGLQAWFQSCRRDNGAALPLWSGALPEGLDFAIECRNSFNYYHFLTETLCHLCVLDDLGFRGRIHLHFPNHESKTRAFVRAFVEALFPELAPRLVLERAPKDYPQVLSAWSFLHSHNQMPPNMAGPAVQQGSSRQARAVLGMNSLDSSLIRLRERALTRIEGMDFSHLPRRFYIGRAAGHARDRRMQGEEALVDLLAAFGFAHLTFEELSPLEQIALMARGEVMVSAHGAGFANMLFANPGMTAIEIGTAQTAQIRWGDFWPAAHASGCRYVTFFADHTAEDPAALPAFRDQGLLPAQLSDRALGRITAYIAAILGHVPRLSRAADVARLAEQLTRSGHDDRAARLIDCHADLADTDAALHLCRADIHKRRGEAGSEIVALHTAYQIDPGRWQTLARLLWAGRKAGNDRVLVWAASVLQADFPDRWAEISRGRDWLLRSAGPTDESDSGQSVHCLAAAAPL